MDAADSELMGACSVRADDPASDVVAELRAVRDSLRDGDGRRSVCTDEVLEEISRRLPVRMEDLAAIPGVGQRFTEQYGEAFLEVSRRRSAIAAGGTISLALSPETLPSALFMINPITFLSRFSEGITLAATSSALVSLRSGCAFLKAISPL